MINCIDMYDHNNYKAAYNYICDRYNAREIDDAMFNVLNSALRNQCIILTNYDITQLASNQDIMFASTVRNIIKNRENWEIS